MNTTEETSFIPLNMTEEAFVESRIAAVLWMIGPPLYLALGTTGNILSAIVMRQPALRQSVTSVYLTVLAFADTLLLWTIAFRHWLRAIADVDIRLTRIGCPLHLFCVYWSSDFASWMVASISVERVVAVLFPHKAKIIFTRKRALLYIASIALFLTVVNAFLLGAYSLKTQGSYACNIAGDTYKSFVFNVWPWIDFTLYSIVPFLVIVICNTAIISKLRLRKKHRDEMASDSKNSSAGKMTSMTAILLTISAVFLLTSVPISVYLLFDLPWNQRDEKMTAHQMARNEMWWAIVHSLVYLNSSTNFLLYCLTSPRFRSVFLGIVCKNKVAPNVHDTSNPTENTRVNQAS